MCLFFYENTECDYIFIRIWSEVDCWILQYIQEVLEPNSAWSKYFDSVPSIQQQDHLESKV